MTAYTVHEPPTPPADLLDRAESLVFVREGFSWPAFLFTPIWLIANRLWLALVAYLAIVGGAQLLLYLAGIHGPWITWVFLGVHFLIGLESSTAHRWTLDRNGWRTIGSVVGRNWPECERRFFESWLPDQPYIKADALSPHGGTLPLSTSMESRPGRWRPGFPFPSRP
ncbi:MAG: DUF2628 domain-containing protein [Sphingomonadales bacterium]|nr:DUF2628 domain-containing protein [Sphingomonadales bacterium]